MSRDAGEACINSLIRVRSRGSMKLSGWKAVRRVSSPRSVSMTVVREVAVNRGRRYADADMAGASSRT